MVSKTKVDVDLVGLLVPQLVLSMLIGELPKNSSIFRNSRLSTVTLDPVDVMVDGIPVLGHISKLILKCSNPNIHTRVKMEDVKLERVPFKLLAGKEFKEPSRNIRLPLTKVSYPLLLLLATIISHITKVESLTTLNAQPKLTMLSLWSDMVHTPVKISGSLETLGALDGVIKVTLRLLHMMVQEFVAVRPDLTLLPPSEKTKTKP